MKKYANYIFIVAGLVGLFMIFKACEKREFDQKVEKLKEENHQAYARITLLQADSVLIRSTLQEARALGEVKEKRFKKRISELEKRVSSVSLANATPQQLDSVRLIIAPGSQDTSYCMPIDAARTVLAAAVKLPIVEEQLTVTGSRVIELAEEKATQAATYEGLLANAGRQLVEERGINGRLNTVIDSYRKHEKKAAAIGFFGKVGFAAAGFLVGALISR